MAKAAGINPKSLLKDVSRSFYLTLRVLPASVRPQIGLAYLLARTSDTIADTQLVPLERRLDALHQLRERILGRRETTIQLSQLAREQSSPAERVLLEQCETTLGLLQNLGSVDQKLVRQVLETILSGQELDLRRFANASQGQLIALRTDEELDDYTYRVAGCVGEFWTRICRAHVFPYAAINEAALLPQSVRFGKGLQLVNILRDLATDLRQGRCYLPESKLAQAGITPEELLQVSNESRLRPLYDSYLGRARDHLLAGWDYTNALPRGAVRVRLACAWPILIGLRTLELLRAGNVLDPQHRIKISRSEVRKDLLITIIYYPWPAAWRRLPHRLNAPVTTTHFSR
jgi:farnesyl-diphosphate farnesyltransferase